MIAGVLIAAAAFSLTSPAFKEGGSIPSKYTCDAGQTNPSPALAWTDAPANTKSFVLIMHDPDAPMAGRVTPRVKAPAIRAPGGTEETTANSSHLQKSYGGLFSEKKK